MLQVQQVTKEYIRNQAPFKAVDNATMTVKPGEFCAIIGHSGSGKSTLLNMIVGMLKPTGGQVLIEGQTVAEKTADQLAHMRNKQISYLMQGQNLLANFTVLDNVCMPAYLANSKEPVGQRAIELLKMMGLEKAAHAYPKELSGGEQRRVAIARALMNKPLLLVADEPTSSLDPVSAGQVIQLLRQVADGGTGVLVSTHDMEFLPFTDRQYVMQGGQLQEKIAEGNSNKNI